MKKEYGDLGVILEEDACKGGCCEGITLYNVSDNRPGVSFSHKDFQAMLLDYLQEKGVVE